MVVTTASQRLLVEHAGLSSILERNPAQAPSLVQTLLDLTHAQRWSHLCVFDMVAEASTRHDDATHLGSALVCGLRPEEKAREVVWTCSFSDMLQVNVFQNIFAALDDLDVNAYVAQRQREDDNEGQTLPPIARDHIILAVHAQDATVVYYKIARGLVKPVN